MSDDNVSSTSTVASTTRRNTAKRAASSSATAATNTRIDDTASPPRFQQVVAPSTRRRRRTHMNGEENGNTNGSNNRYSDKVDNDPSSKSDEENGHNFTNGNRTNDDHVEYNMRRETTKEKSSSSSPLLTRLRYTLDSHRNTSLFSSFTRSSGHDGSGIQSRGGRRNIHQSNFLGSFMGGLFGINNNNRSKRQIAEKRGSRSRRFVPSSSPPSSLNRVNHKVTRPASSRFYLSSCFIFCVLFYLLLRWKDKGGSSSSFSSSTPPYLSKRPLMFHMFEERDLHWGNFLHRRTSGKAYHIPHRHKIGSKEDRMPLLLSSFWRTPLKHIIGGEKDTRPKVLPRPSVTLTSFISEWEKEQAEGLEGKSFDGSDELEADEITHELHPLRDVPSLGIGQTSRHIEEPFREGKFYELSEKLEEDWPDSSKDWVNYFAFDDDTKNNNHDPDCKRPVWYYTNHPSCNVVHERAHIDLFHITRKDRYLASGGYREVWKRSLNDQPVIRVDENGDEMNSEDDKENYENDGRDDNDPKDMVIKRLLNTLAYSDENYDDIRKDAMIMSFFSAEPTIVDIYAYCAATVLVESMDKEVEEYVVPGSGWARHGLKDKESVKPKNEPYLTLKEKVEWPLAMAKTLSLLHGFEGGVIAHCDIQIAQWLRKRKTTKTKSDGDDVKDDEYIIKMGDFNRAEAMLYEINDNQYCPIDNGSGNGNFRAPEEYSPADFITEAADVYSFGNVLYGFLTGLWPHYDKANVKTVQRVVKKGQLAFIDQRYLKRSYYEYRLVTLILQCWTYDPKDRITIFQVVQDLEDLQQLYELHGPDWWPNDHYNGIKKKVVEDVDEEDGDDDTTTTSGEDTDDETDESNENS